MAYAQDISLLMRELLKVPKDNTPTALEITRYIQSRYKITSKDDGGGKRPIGYRAYSSTAVNNVNAGTARPKNQPEFAEAAKPLMVGSNRKMSRKVLELSPVPFRTEQVKPHVPPRKKLTSSTKRKGPNVKSGQDRQTKIYTPNDNQNDRLERRAMQNMLQDTPETGRPSLWNWQRARSRIRQAMSSMVVPNSRNKLMQLAEQYKMPDVKTEVAQEIKKKQMLDQMVDNGYSREPLRTRELIQKLLEDNKVESQKREIAKLMEIAKAKVMQARKTMQEDKFHYRTWQSKSGRMTA